MRAAFPVRRDEKDDTRSQLAGRARLSNSPHDGRVYELLKVELERVHAPGAELRPDHRDQIRLRVDPEESPMRPHRPAKLGSCACIAAAPR